MFQKDLNIAYLLDFYGDILSERKRQVLDDYYNNDLSLSEIAAELNISRQGVREVIVRAEGIMQEVEDKTGLIRRFEAVRGHLDTIQTAATEIKTINYRQYEDHRLTDLAELILNEAAALKE